MNWFDRRFRLSDRLRNLRYPPADPVRLQQLLTVLLEDSKLDLPYLVLIVGSCAIATFGLLSNSAAVIIGAMVIAPLMMPIRGLAYGALIGHVTLFRRGVIAVFIGTLLALGISTLLGLLVGISSFGSEVMARSQPNLLDLGIAVVAGGISGYAILEPKISATLAGTAIAVALMPPICAIGLGLSQAHWGLSQGATLLYVTNLLGITLSCMMVFLVTGYARFEQAKRAFLWALALTAILVLPLGASFVELLRQAQLETALEKVLKNQTVTFQSAQLVGTQINWLVKPPEARLFVRTEGNITPTQVDLLEKFIAKEMGQPFTLIFEVRPIEEVRGTAAP